MAAVNPGLRSQPLRAAQRSALQKLSAIALRLLLSAFCSCALVAVAVSALFVTSAPESISMLTEPVSLLLMPGLMIAMLSANLHDYSPFVVIQGSLIFYCVLFYAVFRSRALTKTSA